MKKRMLIILGIVCVSFCLVYGYYSVSRKNAWKEFLTEYSNKEYNKSFIYNGGVSILCTDEEINELELVKEKELTVDDVKEKRDFVKEIADNLSLKLSTDSIKTRKSIENEETIVFGFINGEDYLYIYENGTCLLCKDGKYYGYFLYDLEAYQTEIIDNIDDFVGSPYFQL